MRSSDIDICNLAITKLGNAEKYITALTDSTVEGRTCNRLYAIVRDLVLTEYRWRPTVKWAELKKKPGVINDAIYFSTLDMFIAVGDWGVIATSIGGAEWTMQNSGVTSDLNAIVAFGSVLVAVGSSGVILTSTDGVTWTARTSGTTKHLYGVCVNGSTTVVTVGAGGVIYSSTDYTTWTSRTSGVSVNLRSCFYGNSVWVAVGDGGTIVYSADFITWTAATSGVTTRLNSVGYGSRFIICGASGVVLTGTNGITWAAVALGITDDLLSFKYSNSTYFITGTDKLLSSPFLNPTVSTQWISQSINGDSLKGVVYSTNDVLYLVLGDQVGLSTDDYTDWAEKEIDFTTGMGFDYAYLAPNDLLNPIGVNDDGYGTLSDTIDYQREGDIIGSDSDPLYMKYIARITDPLKFPEHLVNTIAARLAYEMSPTIRGQVNRQELLSEYRLAIIMAQGMQGRQGFNKGAANSDLWINQGR